ncbi:agmatinase [uncultured Methanobrevibacter sp.]|uniref:agmatinase n=1 Tax=uncultured Methanobrevibacter sp. TaxID=253161 RepID=UPI002624A144|nr:agmatinase [uncultured Methanobrevibacter sp.]
MLLNTYEPWKFAFSQEIIDFDNLEKGAWGIIGVPFDSTTSYHSGSRFGPIVVREASYGFEKYNTIFNTDLDTIFYDFGDVNVIPGNCKKTCDIIEDTVNELSDLTIKPLIIGGEHSLTIGALNSLTKRYDDITVVHLDAHRDLADAFIGEKYSHASVMKRVHEMGIKELIQIGIRSASKEEEDFVKSQSNITTFKNNAVFHHLDNIEYYLNTIDTPIYLSIDMDVFDPSVVPCVGNPTPAGILYGHVEAILQTLSLKNIVGMDVVETAGDRLGDISAVSASKIIYDFLSLL